MIMMLKSNKTTELYNEKIHFGLNAVLISHYLMDNNYHIITWVLDLSLFIALIFTYTSYNLLLRGNFPHFMLKE